MRASIFRITSGLARFSQTRSYTAPRHLLSINDLSPAEFKNLVLKASTAKNAVKSGKELGQLSRALTGKTIAMMFSKRSTRTRVSTEAAVALLGGHPMFLGKDDIQLGACSYLSLCLATTNEADG